MKIAVIADVHGNSCALDKVLQDIEGRSIDQFIILGDLLMKGPEPASVIHRVKGLKPLCWINGNTDLWFKDLANNWEPKTEREKGWLEYYLFAKQRLSEEEIEFIIALPTEHTIDLMGTSILCVHGSPGSVVNGMDYRTSRDELELMVEGVCESIILSGHTHIPFVGEVKGKYIFNVGSVGLSSDGSNLASYGIVELCSGVAPKFEIIRVPYPISETIRIAQELKFPNMYRYEQSLVTGLSVY